MTTLLKSRRQLITYGAAAFGAALILPGCGGGGSDTTVGTRVNNAKSIMNEAEARANLSIFVEAVNACGLHDQLDSSGSNTAFAPTNDAFNALFGELGVSKDQFFANKTQLTAIIKFHILTRVLFSEAVVEGHAIDTMNGGFFKIDKTNNVFRATDGRNRVCTLIGTDVTALNGVLHTLDRVMLPANMDIVVTCQQKPDIAPTCDIAVRCIQAAGLTDTLKQPGPFTFFCPTDAAFTAVLVELNITIDVLLADTARCRQIMTCHMVPQRKFKREFETDKPVATVQGTTIKVNANFQVVDARGRVCNLTTPDVINTNGVVHVCDKVILPAA